MTKHACESCLKLRETSTAVLAGHYYKHVCKACLGGTDDRLSGGSASFERRRGYEDNAQDTIQPYDGDKPNPEFLRLYPEAAAKVFKPEVINNLKRKL